ncbi:hypothetical protein CIPAW_11G071400 [Carya illinoinensis]|uniref:Uncharacterized protein n=1 Tax=Carya illinoinensis TaxID=32201 RepID=A0A8T1P4J6_CARIL|nr:hypothetical protein CIPAW_11G071400 [Carya illinoinensis]
MRFSVDFRYLVPPFTSLCLMFFFSQSNLRPQEYIKNLEFYLLIYHPLLLIFLAIVMLVFLFISFKLPVTLTQDPLRLRVGDFSVPLALSMLSSLIFPPPFFWLVFPVLVLVPSLYRVVSDVLKRFIYWFYQTLQDIPGLIILCTIQPQEEPEHLVLPPQVEIHELV